ncbi:kinesin-like protein KIF14 isoform X1 [Arapaima gigas]
MLFPKLLLPLCGLVGSGYHGAVLVGGGCKSGKEAVLQSTGLVRQLIAAFFEEIAKIKGEECFTTVSYMQFYPDDSATDCLNPERQDLKPRTHPVLGVLVEGVCEIEVGSAEEALSLYEEGRETLKNSGNLANRCSSLYSLSLERRCPADRAREVQCHRSRLQLFDLAGSARKGDLNGVSVLVKVLEGREMVKGRLLPLLLVESLMGNSNNVLLYCVQPQGDLVDEETAYALALAQQIRGLVTRVLPGQWCPRRAAQDIREKIQVLRTKMASEEENGEEDIRRLDDLIQDLQVVKDQDWEKRRIQSQEILEKRKKYREGLPQTKPPGENTDLQRVKERLKLLQTQLRQEMEAHMSEGKVNVEKSQERIVRIQKLREALKEEEGRLIAANKDYQPGAEANQQHEDGSSQMSEVELEYTKALRRRRMIMEEHGAMIQGELEKMERELNSEKVEGVEARLLRLDKERQILVIQLEALRREKLEAERDLEAQHARHTQEMQSLREEGLQVFRVFRQVFEEQKEMMEDRYRTLLLEAIQDAVYLSTKNQQLQAENKQLHRALAELKDTISTQANPGRAGRGLSVATATMTGHPAAQAENGEQ